MIRTRIAVALVLLGSSGCAVRRTGDAREISPKLSLCVYYEQGTQLAIVVGARPSTIRRDAPFIPLEVAVVNKGLPAATVRRESFVLTERGGRSFPAVSSAELVSAGYRTRDLDERFFTELDSLVRAKYPTFERVYSNFTPGFDDGIARDPVGLPRFGYLVDMVYFPNPGIEEETEVLELLVRVSEFPDPLVVRFEIAGSSKGSE